MQNLSEYLRNLPLDIKQYLDENRHMVKTFLNQCKTKPAARCSINIKYIKEIDCFIKYGVERVPNSIKLRKIIEDNNLNLLCVPDKYYYCVDNYDNYNNYNNCNYTNINITNDNCVVVVRRINGKYSTDGKYTINARNIVLNADHVDQLYDMCVLAKYKSLHTLNYILMEDDRICIIDTDSESMLDTSRNVNIDKIHVFDILIQELKKAPYNYAKETYKLFYDKIKKEHPNLL